MLNMITIFIPQIKELKKNKPNKTNTVSYIQSKECFALGYAIALFSELSPWV